MVFEAKQINSTKTTLTWLTVILLIPFVGFWHSWQWYYHRVGASLEEALGLIALFSFLIFLALRTVRQNKVIYQFSLWSVIAFLLLYGVSFFLSVPSIIKAALAFMTISVILYWSSFGRQPPFPFWLLVSLSLPVVPSLQFYLGYPARFISASLSVPLLQMNGLSVTQSGTYLVWQNQMIQFDAPCSGVTMLWAGLFFSLFVSLVFKFDFVKTVFALFIASVLVLIGNVLRATSLFYLEAGLIDSSESWLHEGVGVIAFVGTAFGILFILTRFQQWTLSKKI